MGKLDGKVGIVTGAAHGMGAAHSLALAREGADVACLDICKDVPTIAYPMGTEKELDGVVGEIKALGRRAIAIKCDVSKSAEVEAAVKKVVGEFGRIDILVNNAGVCGLALITDMTEEAWDAMIDVNLKGIFLCCKYVLPHMINQKAGKIINIGSIWGREGQGGATHYCSAKSGVHIFTHALAKEVAPYNINVNAIGPGAIGQTPMFKGVTPTIAQFLGIKEEEVYPVFCKTYHIFNREVTPEEVADAMIYLASEDSRNVNGLVIYVDGGHLA